MRLAAGSTRVAVVGAGYFSQFHLRGWQQLPNVELIGLCDSDISRSRALAKQFDIATIHASVDHMLDALSPDLLDVVTPPVSHAQVIGAALRRGIATICQKPFAANYAQALQLTEQAEAAAVPLIVHENFRFMPWYREARKLIEAGALGTLHGISFRLRPGDGQGPQAYLDRQPYFQTMPRLLIVETAIHLIDTFRFLAGEVRAVYAHLRRLNPVLAGEDAGILVFEFDNGAAGVFDGNRLNEHPAANQRRTMGEMWLEGTGGVLRLDGDARLWLKPHGQPESEHGYDSGDSASFGGGACAALQAHVLAALSSGAEPENTARRYLQNLRIQEAVYHSHRTGARVVIDAFDPSAATSADPFTARLP
jgi:D-apiose dehydrogenase